LPVGDEPSVGDLRLLLELALVPQVTASLRADLDAAGVGASTIRRALFVLQSVMRLAVIQGRVQTNPVKVVSKPRQRREPVRPLTPETVERLRAELDHRGATLVSVLAYAGLRPSEAIALTWSCVRKRTVLVRGAVVLGEEKSTKTHATRTVRLLGPLAQDLAEWRLAQGRPSGDAYVFCRADDKPWRDHDYRNWRKRHFASVVEAIGLKAARPYDLRHSFVSFLIQEGGSVVEVARQAGHSPEECLRTYAHVFEEFDPADRTPAEERIRAARAKSDVHDLYIARETSAGGNREFAAARGSRRPDSNRGPLHYE